jgi:hypothetical protein
LIIAWLLGHDDIEFLTDADGNSPLDLAEKNSVIYLALFMIFESIALQFHEAASKNDLAAVVQLSKRVPLVLNTRRENSLNTALHHSLLNGGLEVALWLLRQDLKYLKNNNGFDVIHAVQFFNYYVLRQAVYSKFLKNRNSREYEEFFGRRLDCLVSKSEEDKLWGVIGDVDNIEKELNECKTMEQFSIWLVK